MLVTVQELPAEGVDPSPGACLMENNRACPVPSCPRWGNRAVPVPCLQALHAGSARLHSTTFTLGAAPQGEVLLPLFHMPSCLGLEGWAAGTPGRILGRVCVWSGPKSNGERRG